MVRFSDNSKHAFCWANRVWQTHWTMATICAIVGLFLMFSPSQHCTAESHYNYDVLQWNPSANQITGQPTSRTLDRTCDPSFHIVAAAGIINRQYSDDRLRLPSIALQIHLRCFKPGYDAPLNNVAETYQPSAPSEMSLYRGYFVPGGTDPSGESRWRTVWDGARWVLQRITRRRPTPRTPYRNADGTIVTLEEMDRRTQNVIDELQRQLDRQAARERRRNRTGGPGGNSASVIAIATLLNEAADLGIDIIPVVGDLKDLPELLEEINGLPDDLSSLGDSMAETNSDERNHNV